MIRPSPITAALAGVFSALAWPVLWTKYGHAASTGGIELIVGTLLLVAVPAHAFVVGFKGGAGNDPRKVDAALLKRIVAWLAASAATALLAMMVRGWT